LPFQNLGSDPDQQRLADAVTANLMTDLSRILDVQVISRDIAFSYRSKQSDAKQLGKELDVRYVVEGSLQRSDDQVQVSFQLVDAKSGTQLRVSRFDSNAANLVEMQDEIVARIARTLKLALLQIERGRIEQERPNHLDAHDLVMLGWARLNLDEPNRAETQRLFERALEIDPNPSTLSWVRLRC
jgi:TolB-like protein